MVLIELQSKLILLKPNVSYSPLVASAKNVVLSPTVYRGVVRGAERLGRWRHLGCHLCTYGVTLKDCYWQYSSTILPYPNIK